MCVRSMLYTTCEYVFTDSDLFRVLLLRLYDWASHTVECWKMSDFRRLNWILDCGNGEKSIEKLSIRRKRVVGALVERIDFIGQCLLIIQQQNIDDATYYRALWKCVSNVILYLILYEQAFDNSLIKYYHTMLWKLVNGTWKKNIYSI